MTVDTVINYSLLIIIIAIAIGSFYVTQIKGHTKKEILRKLKEKAFKLFLYAEKQGWTGPEKMDWCAERLSKMFPENIQKYTKEPLKEYIQKLYNEFKDSAWAYQVDGIDIE